MITKQTESVGYLFALEHKGGPGSGVRGHVTPQRKKILAALPGAGESGKNGVITGAVMVGKTPAGKKQVEQGLANLLKMGFRETGRQTNKGKIHQITGSHPDGHRFTYKPNADGKGTAVLGVTYGPSAIGKA